MEIRAHGIKSFQSTLHTPAENRTTLYRLCSESMYNVYSKQRYIHDIPVKENKF